MSTHLKAILYWAPRILGVLFIFFLSLFALDIFEMNLGFWGTIVGLFMHLIPSFVLITVLVIAWRWELVGGILWLALGIVYPVISPGSFSGVLILLIPVVLIGVLFLVDWMYRRNNLSNA